MADVVTFPSNGWTFWMNASGVSQSGRGDGSQAEIPAAWRRRDCDALLSLRQYALPRD
jgi:hypothetical protein